MNLIFEKVDRIDSKLSTLLQLQSEVITVKGLSILTGWSKGEIYKKTSKGILPYYKPNGKTIYFKKAEIEKWLLSNRQSTKDEIEDQAIDYLSKKNAAI